MRDSFIRSDRSVSAKLTVILSEAKDLLLLFAATERFR
jgi:hypothetical protein